MNHPDDTPIVPGYVYDLRQDTPAPAYRIGGQPPVQPAQPEPPKRRYVGLIIGAVALAVFLLAGTWAGAAWLGRRSAADGTPTLPFSSVSPFQHAQDGCVTGQGKTSIEDGGKTLIIDGSGEGDPAGITGEELTCLFTQMKMPESVKAHVFETRALDGRQEDTWDGFRASWTYHPDDGLDMIVTAD